MKKQIKYKSYHCKFCGTIEFMPEKEYGVSPQEIKSVYCSVCLSENKKKKMIEINKNVSC